MSLGRLQDSKYIIGTSSSAADLTAAFSGNTDTFKTEDDSQLVLYVEYTPAADGRKIQVQVEFGPDEDSVSHQQLTQSIGSSVITMGQKPYEFTGASNGTAYGLRIPIDIADIYTKISVKEDGSGTFGTVTVRASLSNRL